jgi:glycosyltransferase involved in cell wall biosynthesis
LLQAKNTKLKIFAIVSYPFLPATTGGEISTMQFLNHLGKENEVKVFTVEPYSHIDITGFSFELIFGMRFKPWRYLNVLLPFKLSKLIKAFEADVVFFDQPFMAWMIPIVRLLTGKKAFMRCHNIEYLRFKSMDKQWWTLMYMYEKMVHRMADLVIYLSDVDRIKAVDEFNLKSEKTLLVPTGIELESMPIKNEVCKQTLKKRHGLGLNQKLILFFGTMHYAPNYEGVRYILDEVLPSLKSIATYDFCILICGKGLPEDLLVRTEKIAEVKYLGFVADIDEYIDGTDVLLNPILSGGGVKTKVLESIARGQTVVSSYTGAQGIDLSCTGAKLLVAPDADWHEFAQLVDGNLRENLVAETPAKFYEQYSWDGIIHRLLPHLELLKK